MRISRAGLTICLAAVAAPPALAGGLQIAASKPWMRYLLPSVPAGGYLVLKNTSATDAVLTGAASPACGSLMLHESEDASGMAMMLAVPSVTIPAHGSVSFAPGGYHLMCMQPSMEVGGKIPVTLTFQGGASLLLLMPVYGAAGPP